MAQKVIIIGGVAGGASAAARLRRLDETAEIILLEQGEYVSFANCGLPYYIGGVIPKRSALLVQTPKTLNARFRIDVRVFSRAERIDRAKKVVVIRDLAKNETYEESYDTLILSPGASPMLPPVPGGDNPRVFRLRDLPDTDRIKTYLEQHRPRRAVVVGGGFIGIEMVENLAEAGLEVTLVELAPQVLPTLDPEMAAIVAQHMTGHGVHLCLGVSLSAIEDSPNGALTCTISTGCAVTADMVIMAVGIRPDTKLAADAGLALGPNGSVLVDEQMRTSDPHVYAVGDATAFPHFVLGDAAVVALAGPANRQGRIAADNAAGRPSVYGGSQGTSAAKIFELTAGSTGANEKQLAAAKRPFGKVHLHPDSHAGYYPGAATLSMKLLYDTGSGKILGAQAVGEGGVDKRIDVLATAIRAGMTVYDLEKLELSYAPPYSSAKDPVNMAGFTAANVLKGDFRQLFIEDLAGLDPVRDCLLDVRTAKEYAEGTIGDAINIPLNDLRSRLAEVPKNRRLVVFCRAGLRGYIACRILQQSGFEDVYNLSGGYLTWAPVYGPQAINK